MFKPESRAMPQKTRAMPWAKSCQPFRLGPWLLVFTLKGWELSDQGIALVFWGIALVFGVIRQAPRSIRDPEPHDAVERLEGIF